MPDHFGSGWIPVVAVTTLTAALINLVSFSSGLEALVLSSSRSATGDLERDLDLVGEGERRDLGGVGGAEPKDVGHSKT